MIGNFSINHILGKGVAVCTERTTLMHNILVLSCIKSNFVFGSLNSEGHAYVLLQNKRSKAILDVTNFVYYMHEGKMYGEPILVFISEEEYETIVTGGKYKLDIVKLVSKRIPENDLNFTYEGNFFR